ncbi:unnamed protein product [Mucor hiemalis]
MFRRFPPSSVMMGYTGQSLLVIIVSILIIIISILVLRNLGRVLVHTAWKISVSCIGFSLASIAFRTFSAWFVVSPSDEYYISTYNVTSYFIVVGAIIWIPFIFCKTNKYMPDTSTADAERFRIRSTGGERRLFTHRPHQDEDNQSITTGGAGEILPSYYEMLPPPLYKNLTPSINNNNSSNGQSPNENLNNTITAETSSGISNSITNGATENRTVPNTENRTTVPSINTENNTVIEMSENNPQTTPFDNNGDQQPPTYQLNQPESTSTNTRQDNTDSNVYDRPVEHPTLQNT